MKKVIAAISYILSFLLMICIVAIISMNLVKAKILNKEYIIKTLEDVNYYEVVTENINDGFEKYYYQSGLEHYVIENLYDENKVKSDTKQIIDAIYDNAQVNIETESIKENLRNNIDDMLEKQNKRLESSQDGAVETFINLILDTYKSEITVYESGIKTASKTIEKVESIINRINKLILIITIAIVVIIIAINIKKIFKVTNYLGISLLSSGLLGLLVNLAIQKAIKINNLFTLTKAMSEVVKHVLLDALNSVQTYSIILFIVGLVLVILHAILKNREND